MQRSALCRSRRELSYEYLLAKISVDTAENEPLEVWGIILFNIIQSCPYSRHAVRLLREVSCSLQVTWAVCWAVCCQFSACLPASLTCDWFGLKTHLLAKHIFGQKCAIQTRRCNLRQWRIRFSDKTYDDRKYTFQQKVTLLEFKKRFQVKHFGPLAKIDKF